jgi:hypothetical protein
MFKKGPVAISFEVCGCHSSVDEDSRFLGCYFMSIDELLPKFRNSVISSPSESMSPRDIELFDSEDGGNTLLRNVDIY